MCRVENYIKATFAATVQLGLALGSTTNMMAKPTWATFLQAAGHLTSPPSPKIVPDQEHGIEHELQNQAALVSSAQEAPAPSFEMVPFADIFPISIPGEMTRCCLIQYR